MKAYLVLFFGLAFVIPLFDGEYLISAGTSILLYATLGATWATFTGPARYLSLATSAFFGAGVYTVAIGHESLPWPVLIFLAFVISALLALAIGASSLRLQGIYFTVFTYGLAELARQAVTWIQRNLGGSVGNYVFVEVSPISLYWILLSIALGTLLAGLAFLKSYYGVALTAVGDNEVAARHIGLKAFHLRSLVFALSSGMIGVVGAVVAPRWVYVDPNLAFNPNVSFITAITALLGGLKSPVGAFLAAPPFVLLHDFLSGRFPNHTTALMGLAFILLVYFLPHGFLGLFPQKNPKVVKPKIVSPLPDLRAFQIKGPLLKTEKLRKSFGGLVAVASLDMEVHPQEAVGVIGPNGSGKTTALGLLAGTLKPDRGCVRFQGQEVTGQPPEVLAQLGLARTFQQVRLFPSLTAYQHVFLPLKVKGLAQAKEVTWALLWKVGLEEKAHHYPSSLTYLEQKRLELARSLALSPRLLLLDEWLAGLSPSELKQALALLLSIKQEGISLIIVEHLMPAIRILADRVYVLSFGELVAQGPPEVVLQHPKVVEAYLGVEDA